MKKDSIIMTLTALLIVALLLVTWAEIAVSSWIVGHSGVEDLMHQDRKETLLFLKDAFFHYGSEIFLLELGVGVTLLWLLYRKLSRV